MPRTGLTVSTVNLRGGRINFEESRMLGGIGITLTVPELGTITAVVRLETAERIGQWFLSRSNQNTTKGEG